MSMEPESPAPSNRAAEKTNLPGIFLLIVGILNILGALWYLYSGVDLMSKGGQAKQQFEEQIAKEAKGKTEEQKKQLEQAAGFFDKFMSVGPTGFFAIGAVSLLTSALTVLGAIKMRSLQSRGLALTGAILAMIPCISATGCCGVGEGIGIWALVVLMNAEVKAAFR